MVRGKPRHVVSYLKEFLSAKAGPPVRQRHCPAASDAVCCWRARWRMPSNLLVLDEPTNDLDIETLDLLQEMLTDYDGTVLLVSHDRDFLDRVVTSIIALDGAGNAVEYPGGYSDYLTQSRHERGEAARPRRAAAASARPERAAGCGQARLQGPRRALEELRENRRGSPRKSPRSKRSSRIRTLRAQPPTIVHKATARHDALRAELAAAEELWLELELKREALSGV